MTTSVVAQDAAGTGIVRITKTKAPVAADTAKVVQTSMQQVQPTPTPNAPAPSAMSVATAPGGNGACATCTGCQECQGCQGMDTFDLSSARDRRRLRRMSRGGDGWMYGERGRFGGRLGGSAWGDDYGLGGDCDDGCNSHSCCCCGCSHEAICNYLRCKFGYFIPTGGGGKGVPWAGCYSRVYPVDPYYRDARDGQAWAAQGYGIPMAVPLAPVVGHAYDYSWGVPSSRLTPISNPAY